MVIHGSGRRLTGNKRRDHHRALSLGADTTPPAQPSETVFTFMGRGGQTPALCVVDAFSAAHLGRYPLASGETPYGIAQQVERKAVAFGTKRGGFHVGHWPESTEDIAAWEWRKCDTKDPILSVVPEGSNSFLSSHISGCARRWNLDQDPLNPQTIIEHGAPVLALTVDRSGAVWGLTPEDGVIVIGRSSDGVRVIPVPSPCGILSLNQCRQWGATEAFAYAGQGGYLVIVHPDTGKAESIPAHHGSFIVIGMVASHAVTIGSDDTQCLLWDPSNGQMPVQRLRAPKGVISGCPMAGTEPRLLLVKEDGTAGIYRFENQDLCQIEAVDGRDYRVAVAPDAVAVARALDQCRHEEASQIRNHIMQSNGRAREIELAQSYQRLEQLGRRDDVLRLRAYSAEEKEQWADSLAARHELARLLPVSEQTLHDMIRYLEQLERTAQWSKAVAVAESMRTIRPDVIPVEQQNRLRSIETILKNDQPLLNTPAVPVEEVIVSADHLGQPCRGRYVFRELPAICGKTNFAAAEHLVSKCRQMTQEIRPDPGVRITAGPCWWLQDRDLSEMTTILFKPLDETEIRGLQIAGRFHATGTAMEIAMAAVFDTTAWPIENGEGTHNQMLQRALARLKQSPVNEAWVNSVIRLLRTAVKRIENDNIPDNYGEV
jgi:hypothetical protein